MGLFWVGFGQNYWATEWIKAAQIGFLDGNLSPQCSTPSKQRPPPGQYGLWLNIIVAIL
jgi:hypothetical protein